MAQHRHGEQGAIPFRSGRFFNIDSVWYFACREGKDFGPFNSKPDALKALDHYLDRVTPEPAKQAVHH